MEFSASNPEIERLLSPVDAASPSGPNLEYEPDFMELEQLAAEQPEQQFGDVVVKASEPDWRKVRDLSVNLLERSKDLRVAMLYVRSACRLDGLSGFVDGLELTTGLLCRFWDSVHPEIEEGDDVTMRLSSLAALTSTSAVVGDLRKAALVRSRAIGEARVRDVEVMLGRLPASDDEPGMDGSTLTRLFAEELDATKAAAEKVRRAFECCRQIESFLADQSAYGLELAPLVDTLRALRKVLDDATGGQAETGVAVDADEGGLPTAGMVVTKPAVSTPGTIASREDVIRTLDLICRYIETNEPSNPAPLLLRRAQKLMSMNFVEIIKELTPDSISQIESLAGLNR